MRGENGSCPNGSEASEPREAEGITGDWPLVGWHWYAIGPWQPST